jgi:four helix bundle protein
MQQIRNFRDLVVWQRGMELVDESYRLVKALPASELYGLRSQIVRAAVSVPTNIAEGHGRESRLDFARFLDVAKGSLLELETLFEIGRRQDFWVGEQLSVVKSLLDECCRMVESLRRKLRATSNTVREEATPYGDYEDWTDVS